MCYIIAGLCEEKSLTTVLGGSKQIWSRADSYGLPTSRPLTVHYTERAGVVALFMTFCLSTQLQSWKHYHRYQMWVGTNSQNACTMFHITPIMFFLDSYPALSVFTHTHAPGVSWPQQQKKVRITWSHRTDCFPLPFFSFFFCSVLWWQMWESVSIQSRM